MKRTVFWALVLFLALQVSAFAAGQVKIGVVDTGKVFSESEPGKDAFGKLKAKFETMTKDLERQKKEVTKLREDLQKQGLVLSLEAKQDKELEFKRKVRDFQDTSQAYQQKFAMEKGRLSEPILKLLVEVVKDYGIKNGFTMLVDKNARVSGLLFNDPAIDVTDKITAELNSAWKTKGNK
ncbi:MAG: OmpH family outer membrane protein [Desulfovibrionaceae bacterium]|nr:OmpH family outer membrane protein [Desulfovibrionaceae bacterium]